MAWAISVYENDWERSCLRRRIPKPFPARTPAIEFMDLGLEGGEKKQCWDRVKREYFWTLAVES